MMKKLLLIALVLTFAAGSAIAQQQGGPGSHGGKGKPGNAQSGGQHGNPVERLTESLGLDEVQAEAIAIIFEENQLLREEERERACVASEEMRANTHTQILEVLTSEQQVLFEEHHQQREAMKQAFEEMRAERGFGDGRGNRNCDS